MRGLKGKQSNIPTFRLINKLERKAKELGMTPTQLDIEIDPDMPGTRLYQNRFGSYSAACKEAGLEPNAGRRRGKIYQF